MIAVVEFEKNVYSRWTFKDSSVSFWMCIFWYSNIAVENGLSVDE